MSPATPPVGLTTPVPTAAISEHATPELHGSYPSTYRPYVLAAGARWSPVPARCASGPPVPAFGTQHAVLPLLLQQHLVLVHAVRLILHTRRDRCARWTHRTHGMQPGACTYPQEAVGRTPSGIGLLAAPACWPAAVGTQKALHTSLRTRSASHTVMLGDSNRVKVRGVSGVHPVAEEALSAALAWPAKVDQLTLKLKSEL